ncbi:MAG: helix-turn-helix domain-containing protein [Candidatus Aphodocola sp.]
MIYERMKEIREYFGDTQKAIAETLNTTRSTYAGWENGLDAIPLLKLNEFCNHYGISLDYVCGLTNIKKYEIINTTIDKEVIGNNLKQIRIENNDTQDYVANSIKIDQSNYSKYELGKILIHTYPLIEYAKLYNISIDYICGKRKNSDIK